MRKTVPAGGKRYVYYVCSGNKRDKHKCSSHSISEKKLMDGVLDVVKNYIGRVIAAAFAVEMIYQTPEMKPDIVKFENRLQKLREEAESCNNRKKNLYEDYKDGILSRDEYSMLRDQYQNQLGEIEKSIETITAERDGILANGTGKQEWIEKLRKYKGVNELDRKLSSFIIERVEVVKSNAINVTLRFEKALAEMEHMIELYSGEIKEAM